MHIFQKICWIKTINIVKIDDFNNISQLCHHGNGLLIKYQQIPDYNFLAKRLVL